MFEQISIQLSIFKSIDEVLLLFFVFENASDFLNHLNLLAFFDLFLVRLWNRKRNFLCCLSFKFHASLALNLRRLILVRLKLALFPQIPIDALMSFVLGFGIFMDLLLSHMSYSGFVELESRRLAENVLLRKNLLASIQDGHFVEVGLLLRGCHL